MHLRSGELDRRITLQRKTQDRDQFDGSLLSTSISEVSVLAKYVPPTSFKTESLAGNQVFAQAECEFWIRWRADVDQDTAIIYKNQKYEVVADPIEINRREGLRLLARRFREES